MSDCDNKRKKKGLKPCKPSQICNPETTRCVSRTGETGKKLLKKTRSKSKARRSKSKSKARRSKSKSKARRSKSKSKTRRSKSKSKTRRSKSKSKTRRSKSKSKARKSKSKSKARKSKSKSVKIDYSKNIKFIATQIFGQTGALGEQILNLTLSKAYRDKLSSYIDKTVKFLVEKLNTMSLKEFSERFNTNSLEENANLEGTKAIGNSLRRVSKTTDDAIFFKSFYVNIVKNIMKYKKKTSSRLQDIEFIAGYCEYMLAELVELSIEDISDEGIIPLDVEKKTVTAAMLSKAVKNDKELAKFYS